MTHIFPLKNFKKKNRKNRLKKNCLIALLVLMLGVSGWTTIGWAGPLPDFEVARAAMQNQDWETANYTWRHILSAEPNTQEAIQGLAESLFRTGFFQESLDLLLSLPKNSRPLSSDYAIARTYKAMRDYPQSKAAYIQLLIKNPYQAAAISEAQELLPNLSTADQKELSELLDMVAKASKKRGDAAIQQKKYQEATEYYEIVATRMHTVGTINDYALLLMLTGQYQKAHEQFLVLDRKNKLGFSEAQSNAAIASLSLGNFSQAKSEIQRAITQADNDNRLKARLYNNMGYILEMSRRRTEAKFAYEHALSLDPAMLTAQLNLAFVQQANREYDEAIRNYLSILKNDPQNTEVWNRLGFAYELQYKSRLAQNAYKKAIQYAPNNTESYYNLATLYKKMGKMQDMNEVMKQIAELSYQEMETKSGKRSSTNSGNDLKKNPLKFMTLFASNPQLTASLK